MTWSIAAAGEYAGQTLNRFHDALADDANCPTDLKSAIYEAAEDLAARLDGRGVILLGTVGHLNEHGQGFLQLRIETQGTEPQEKKP